MVEEMTVAVRGMMCRGCEGSILMGISRVPGLRDARARYDQGTVTIWYDGSVAKPDDFVRQLKVIGYPVAEQGTAGRTLALLGLTLCLAALFSLLRLVPSGSVAEGAGPWDVFVMGLVTGIHCIAMCGGIMLANITSSFQKPASGRARRGAAFRGFVYNASRAVACAAVGAACGALGGHMLYAPLFKGLVLLFTSTWIVLMGLNAMGVLRLPAPTPGWNGPVSHLSNALRQLGPIASSALLGCCTAFMPCGALSSAWLIAAASGSALAGAFDMLCFALGTAVCLQLLASSFSLMPRKLKDSMPVIGGVLTAALGLTLLKTAVKVLLV